VQTSARQQKLYRPFGPALLTASLGTVLNLAIRRVVRYAYLRYRVATGTRTRVDCRVRLHNGASCAVISVPDA